MNIKNNSHRYLTWLLSWNLVWAVTGDDYQYKSLYSYVKSPEKQQEYVYPTTSYGVVDTLYYNPESPEDDKKQSSYDTSQYEREEYPDEYNTHYSPKTKEYNYYGYHGPSDPWKHKEEDYSYSVPEFKPSYQLKEKEKDKNSEALLKNLIKNLDYYDEKLKIKKLLETEPYSTVGGKGIYDYTSFGYPRPYRYHYAPMSMGITAIQFIVDGVTPLASKRLNFPLSIVGKPRRNKKRYGLMSHLRSSMYRAIRGRHRGNKKNKSGYRAPHSRYHYPSSPRGYNSHLYSDSKTNRPLSAYYKH